MPRRGQWIELQARRILCADPPVLRECRLAIGDKERSIEERVEMAAEPIAEAGQLGGGADLLLSGAQGLTR
jgi:hypothetical protein